MEFSSNLTLGILNEPFLLEKRIRLLNAIEQYGSILKAAKNVPMSYKAAWDSIDAMNNLSPQPIVNRSTGGKNGGGTSLTEYGKKVVELYTLFKSEQERFLQTLSREINFNHLELESIRRLSMNISARNQISGTVEHIERGKVNASVFVKLKSGYTLVSIITNHAVEALDLALDDRISAIFKSNNVLITTDNALNISARNKFIGTIIEITQGAINASIKMDLGNGDTVLSTITTDALFALGLQKGVEACAIVKASDIMIGK
ncbi:MAG: molybdenum-binding protein [Sulfurovum sp. PC08-66]|nr:MAG: molybdenum-binding protein [Sulfurovum sp. PC08-66]